MSHHARYIANLLSQFKLFEDLKNDDLLELARHTREVPVKRGDIIFRRGDRCDGFYYLVSGQVKLSFMSPQGEEKVIDFLQPHHIFGETMMFTGKPHIKTAQALEDALLLHVSRGAVLTAIERHPAFARKLLERMSRRLHGLLHDVEAYSLTSGTHRVLDYLMREVKEECKEVTLPTSKTLIASRLNLTPAHLSRILHNLVEQHLIRMHGRSIMIPSMDKLHAYLASEQAGHGGSASVSGTVAECA